MLWLRGVFRGEFASKINKCFPNSKLYLFDTFEGFDERDVKIELDRKFSGSEKTCLVIHPLILL